MSPFAPCGPCGPWGPIMFTVSGFASPPSFVQLRLPEVSTLGVKVQPCGPRSPATPCGPVSPCGPASPWGPGSPCSPFSPVSPLGPASPGSPFSPCGPWGPGSPCGPVAPVSPFGPWAPVSPFSPRSPCGPRMSTGSGFGIAASFVQLSSPVSMSTLGVKVAPRGPRSPWSPFSPVSPLSPLGSTKSRTAWVPLPTFVTAASSPLVTVPISTVALSPGGPCTSFAAPTSPSRVPGERSSTSMTFTIPPPMQRRTPPASRASARR